MLAIILFIQFCGEVAAHVLHSVPWAIREALWDGEGVWTLYFASGTHCTATLEPDSLVTIPLIVLNFRIDSWRWRSLILTTDNCDQEVLRRLRVRLRLEGAQPALAPTTPASEPP